jgi:PhoD related phosphatase
MPKIDCTAQHYFRHVADVAPDSYVHQDPTYLWRDLMAVHSAFPMHCLVGGGDQLYNDDVWQVCPTLKAWGDAAG